MLPLTIRTTAPEAFQERDLARVHSWRDTAGQVCAQGYVGPGARWMRWPGLVTFRLTDRGDLEAFPETSLNPRVIVDLWRRTVQPLMLQAIGWETLHASAVLLDRAVVGFCGERETGKSTIAYGFGRRGCQQLADDTLVLQVSDRAVRVLTFPFDPRLRPEASGFFEKRGMRHESRGTTAGEPRDEATDMRNRELAALFVLKRVEAGEVVSTRLRPATAFTALLAHAHCFAPDDPAIRRRVLERYLGVAATVPVFELRFQAGLERLDAVLTCVERSVYAAAPAAAVPA